MESRKRFSSGGLLILRRRIVAGPVEESSVVLCGKDVGPVLAVELEELVDNPGTTIGTELSVLHWIFLPFLVKRVFYHCPTHSVRRSIP